MALNPFRYLAGEEDQVAVVYSAGLLLALYELLSKAEERKLIGLVKQKILLCLNNVAGGTMQEVRCPYTSEGCNKLAREID